MAHIWWLMYHDVYMINFIYVVMNTKFVLQTKNRTEQKTKNTKFTDYHFECAGSTHSVSIVLIVPIWT